MTAGVDVAGRLRERFGESILGQDEFRGDLSLTLRREVLHDALQLLRDAPDLDFNFFVDVTVVDWLVLAKQPRFEVVYHLYSLAQHRRVRLKVPVEEDDCWLPTAIDLWPGADWFEREAWDMFGVVFEGHPTMRRLLCHEAFEGHALRKDFPADKRFFLIRPSDLRDQAPDWVKERSGGERAGGYIRD